jgi:hypothetical protein
MQEVIVIGQKPTFTSITVGSFRFRIATQADVDGNEAQAVGNLLVEVISGANQGTRREFEEV